MQSEPIMDPEVLVGAAAPAPPSIPASSPADWAKKNLFNGPGSSIVTVVFGLLAIIFGYRLLRFLFVTGQWEAVRTNLTLFMVGTFPRLDPNNELWRVPAQLFCVGTATGLFAGANSASERRKAEAAGLAFEPAHPKQLIKRFWSVILFVVVTLGFVRTLTPVLVVVGVLALAIIGFVVGRALPGRSGFVAGALAVIAAFQIVSGTTGAAWLPVAIVLGAVAWQLAAGRVPEGIAGIAAKVAVVIVTALVIRTVYGFVDHQGVGWEKWSGLMLTLTLAACAIVFSFPFGLLLALARRSQLPVIRWLATVYIELIRGVPLITLLFMGQFLLGFFLDTDVPLANVTRAIVAMTLFTAAYVAEIVRGGLQSLPKGQTEAGQALGLAPTQTMRLIVLPQALRAVIPAMVGQFISLFKDTTLVFIVGLTGFLGVRDLVHGQADFRAVAHAETLVYAAFGFWAFAFAMSRESQLLERKLGVGTR